MCIVSQSVISSKFEEVHLSAHGSSMLGNTPRPRLLRFLESFLAVLSVHTLHLFSIVSKGLQLSVSLGMCIWNPIYQSDTGSTQQSLCSESPCIVTDAMPKSCTLARAICFLVNASLKDRPIVLLLVDKLQMIRCMQVLSVA